MFVRDYCCDRVRILRSIMLCDAMCVIRVLHRRALTHTRHVVVGRALHVGITPL